MIATRPRSEGAKHAARAIRRAALVFALWLAFFAVLGNAQAIRASGARAD